MKPYMDTKGDSPDVETTNWNAVKLLATRYGIQLRTLEEVHASFLETGRESYEQSTRNCDGPSTGQYSNEEDLGAGTPFVITAQMVDGGRVIYRFKHRDGDALIRGNSSEGREASSSLDAGYDPDPDSPSSSWGKSAEKKKSAPKTLKTKRSVPILQSLSSGGFNKTGMPLKNKRSFSAADAKTSRIAPPPKIQRGDVLGAILGLREGVSTRDKSWETNRRDGLTNYKKRAGKGKADENRGDDHVRFAEAARNRHIEVLQQSMSPFGETVLQKSRDVSFASHSMPWQKSPIPKMAEFGQPLFSDPDEAFKSTQPASTLVVDDAPQDTLIFDVLQRETEETDDWRLPSSPTTSAPRSRQTSASTAIIPTSPTVSDGIDTSTKASVPVDDPRFALWAVRSRADGDALVLSSRNGFVPPSPLPSPVCTPGSGRHFSLKSPSTPLDEQTPASMSTEAARESKAALTSSITNAETVMMIAASSAYLIAELTSRIDNRLMTDFFYTYRAYMTSHELLHLLILRFKWAMITGRNPKDETRRKIARVRTYVVIKYWLSNFFDIDFVPNRILRKELTEWLNALSQEDALPDFSIIKSLKKIVRGLKQNYEQGGVGGILLSDLGHSPISTDGQKAFHESESESAKDDVDSNEQVKSPSEGSHASPIQSDPPWKSSNGTTAVASSSITSTSSGHNAPPPLPNSHQNAISKAFVNTVGRFSRFKRNMNTRNVSGGHSSHAQGYDGGEHEVTTECGDLLFIQGGVESFLAFFNLHAEEAEVISAQIGDAWEGKESECTDLEARRNEEEVEIVSDENTAQEVNTPSLSSASNQTESTPASSIDLDINDANSRFGLGFQFDQDNGDESTHLTHANLAMAPKADLLHHFQSDQTLRSLSTAVPTPTEETRPAVLDFAYDSDDSQSDRGGPNIVQIDDIDLSSDEDDEMVRRALRRLPGARDLRMANNVRELAAPIGRTSMDSISASSFGRVHGSFSHQSLASHFNRDTNRDPRGGIFDEEEGNDAREIPIGTVHTEMFDPDEALQGYELVKGFRLDHLDSDEEEAGDVEAALRRLEGFIDEDKQKKKAQRVEAMWLRSQNPNEQEGEEENKEVELVDKRQSAPVIQLTAPEESLSHNNPIIERPSSPSSSVNKRSQVKSQVMQKMNSNQGEKMKRGASGIGSIPLRIWNLAPTHRSFLLDYRSEVIAQQFCLIELELFTSVTWQELVSDQWKKRNHTGQVLDWTIFYKDRIKKRSESQQSCSESISQETNVEAIVARFNLTCNWVASEIVITKNVDDRAAIICKLIRIAWKCYHYCNFSTLTQIILGLQSPWVERLSRTWSRIGMLEMRMLRDLKAFSNPARNFKHLRMAMKEMMIQGGMEDLITSSGPPKIKKNKGKQQGRGQMRLLDGCIPFFGLFLSDLAVYDSLPTYIEPSSPGRPINIDSNTGHLTHLVNPRAFDHLPPLPLTLPLSPLINLYKYRMMASTIKSILALQERLTSFEYQVDAEVYVKTLRLRCLEGEQLTQISHLVEP